MHVFQTEVIIDSRQLEMLSELAASKELEAQV